MSRLKTVESTHSSRLRQNFFCLSVEVSTHVLVSRLMGRLKPVESTHDETQKGAVLLFSVSRCNRS